MTPKDDGGLLTKHLRLYESSQEESEEIPLISFDIHTSHVTSKNSSHGDHVTSNDQPPADHVTLDNQLHDTDSHVTSNHQPPADHVTLDNQLHGTDSHVTSNNSSHGDHVTPNDELPVDQVTLENDTDSHVTLDDQPQDNITTDKRLNTISLQPVVDHDHTYSSSLPPSAFLTIYQDNKPTESQDLFTLPANNQTADTNHSDSSHSDSNHSDGDHSDGNHSDSNHSDINKSHLLDEPMDFSINSQTVVLQSTLAENVSSDINMSEGIDDINPLDTTPILVSLPLATQSENMSQNELQVFTERFNNMFGELRQPSFRKQFDDKDLDTFLDNCLVLARDIHFDKT